MAPLKMYFLTAEITPFSETYELSRFSRKITSILHDKTDVDIHLSQPKYGFVSERKYLLREVIRLKDLPVVFNGKRRRVNMKSSFIPETRVQVYFMQDDPYYKKLPELIYKARNGRIFSDIDERFAFFSKAALDTLERLFWCPDVLICNDWQTSLVPVLLNKKSKENEFYKNMKTAYIIHSVNDYRKYSKDTYTKADVDPGVKGSKIDSHAVAMENADLVIAINYETSNTLGKLKKQKKLYDIFEQKNNLVIDIPKKTNKDIWIEAANTIESAIRDL